MLGKLKRSAILYFKKLLRDKFKNIKFSYAKENPQDQNIDLYNDEEEYVTTVPASAVPDKFTSVVEQNESGIGRPKIVTVHIKKNRSKYTVREEGSQKWNFLPYTGFKAVSDFIKNIDPVENKIEVSSKIMRGELTSVKLPENRLKYLRSIYLKGAAANPYLKESVEDKAYISKKHKQLWNL